MLKLLRFYLPLAVTASLWSGAHVIVTAVLARTPAPTQALAAYGLALGVSAVAEGPVAACRQLSLALGSTTPGFRRAWQAVWTLALPVLGLELLVAYTPVGRAVLSGVFRIAPDLLAPTRAAYRVLMWMAAASAFRFLYQGYLVRHQHTQVIAAGVGARILVTAALGLWLGFAAPLPGAVTGAVMLLAGMAAEALVGYLAARPLLAAGATAPDIRPVPTFPQTLLFFVPLAGAQLAASSVAPAINGSLAASAGATIAVAAYATAQTVSGLITSPVQSMHQVSLVFATGAAAARQTLRFAVAVAAVASGVLALLAFTPVGNWFLGGLLHLSSELAAPVRLVLRAWTLLPLVMATSDYLTGLLLLRRNSRTPGLARLINVAAVLLLSWWQIAGAQTGAQAAVRGAVALLCGYALEAAINLGAVLAPGRETPVRAGLAKQ